MQNYLIPVPKQFSESGLADAEVVWIEALPAIIHHTPQYGPVPVTTEKLHNFVDNFKKNVVGTEISTDYDHGEDKAKGNQASGQMVDMKVAPGGLGTDTLHVAVKFTDTAKKETKEKAWRYFSLDWDEVFMDNDGKIHNDVVRGGALTNRPISKRIMPINFSEVAYIEAGNLQFSELTYEQRNSLPKSAFLYCEPDGTCHLPYKNADGTIDLSHLRNAISRLSQKATGSVDGKSWLTDSLRTRLLGKARRLLGAKAMSEAGLVTDEFVEILDAQEEEFMEPGTNAPDYTINEDDSRWRIDTPPGAPPDGGEDGTVPTRVVTNAHDDEGGEMDDFEKQLRETLGLADDVDVVKYITDVDAELKGLKDTARQFSENKKFSEQYPDEWNRMQKLESDNRELQARRFSESLASRRITRVEGENEEDTTLGLSALALDTLKDVHIKFSEGIATSEDFNGMIEAIYKGGVVDYGEKGSTRGDDSGDGSAPIAGDAIAVRRQFSEAVDKVKAREGNEKMKHGDAIAVAALENPELAEAFKNSSVVLAAVS